MTSNSVLTAALVVGAAALATHSQTPGAPTAAATKAAICRYPVRHFEQPGRAAGGHRPAAEIQSKTRTWKRDAASQRCQTVTGMLEALPEPLDVQQRMDLGDAVAGLRKAAAGLGVAVFDRR